MKTLRYDVPHNGARLYDELVAGVPALKPIKTAAGFVYPFTSWDDGDGSFVLNVEDDVDEAAIKAVVAAHDPNVVEPTAPNPYREMRDGLAAAKTLGDVQQAFIPALEQLADQHDAAS